MPHISKELASDWVDFVKASLETRIEDTKISTEKVLSAVQTIAVQLSGEADLKNVLSLKADQATPAEIMKVLQDILDRLDNHDALAQLIAPLFMALQFEDRTRQKLEGILEVTAIWADMRNKDMSEEEIAMQLKAHVVTMDQQVILAKHFPDHIQAEDDAESIDLF